MIMVVMANSKKVVSSIVSDSLDKFKDNFTNGSYFLSFRTSSSSKIHTGMCPPKTILARFHSTSSSNSQTLDKHPRSVYEKITKVEDALKLFDEMTQRQPLPSVIKLNQLLQAVAKMKHYSCSIELFKQMNALHVPVDNYTINIVIRCCCQMQRTRDGFSVLGYGFKHAVVPDVCTFNTLLNGLVLEDRVLEAERLFKKLIKEGLCEPDTIMYSTMIKGLCKFGINDTAIALLKLMDERGCKPTVVTYSTIIDSLCMDKMVDDAFNLFKEMVFHKGILPDVVTYNILLQGFLRNQQHDMVEMLLHEMEGKGFSLDASTVSLLLGAIKARTLDASLLKLIGKLVPKEGVDIPCFSVL